METKRSTTEEEVVSNPASSPASCEDVCSQSEEHDDFVSLMDENGIIGLLEALEIVGGGEYPVDGERVHEGLSGLVMETQLDAVGYQHSHRKSPGRDAQMLPPSPGGVFPEEGLSDADGTSLNGSRCSDWSCPPSRRIQRRCLVAARSSASFRTASLKNTSSQPDSDLNNPTASTNAAALNKSSNSHLNGCTPDYSKVKPRVNFPKVSYKPPKSKLRSKGDSLSFRPPIGAEDSRDMPDAPPATPDTAGGFQELRSHREATRLLSELEESYNKLWIKYAEAENTIDHLRLAAKVNLYSDGPKPGPLVQSVYNHEASKFMMLNFPQAQRAETCSISLPSDEQRTPQNPPVTKEPSATLYTQANDFLQRLQIFEDLLKCQQLSPDEQRKELSQLFEGLRSLESSYLLAKDEHKLLPKEEENRHFDPDRELEGLIFDCVLYMDELKEHTGQIQEDLLTREPSPSPACSASPSEGRGNLSHPQKTHRPSLVYPPEQEATTLNSVSGESNREEAWKETATSLCLKTINSSLGPSGEFNALPDDHQNFREIPQALELSQKNKALLPTASKTDMQAGGSEENGPDQKIENQKVKESPQQRNLSPEDFAHRYISQAIILDHSGRQEGFEMRTSHGSSLSSLGEIAASEKRSSNLQGAGGRSVPFQDGIISPETDSGFNGTESCHPTPTEAPSPLHQRAMESVSVVQDRSPKNPHNGLVTSPDLFPLLPRCCPATELSTMAKFDTKHPRRTKPRKAQRRKTFTCAHQCWTKKSNSGTTDVESSRSTVSDDGQSGCYRESVTSLSPSSSCSSQPCHGGCTKVPRSTQATDTSISMQMLQAEVSRLHHRLESCLKERERLVTVSETTVPENHPHPRTSTPRVSNRKVNTYVTAAVRKRPCCALEQGPHPEIYHPQAQSAVSRCTQTVSAASDGCSSRPSAVHTKHRSVSVQAPETHDEPDAEDLSFHSSHPLSPCRRCISRQQAYAENSVPGNSKAATRSCCSHHGGSTDTDCHRVAHANTNTWHQAAETVKCCAAAAPPPPPPPPLQYVCPLSLLLCSSRLCAPPSNKKDTTTRFLSPNELKSRRKRSPSADRQDFLERSLNKAIRAAKHMESTSGHMSRSLRSGLQHQQLLLTPLMAQLSQRQTSS